MNAAEQLGPVLFRHRWQIISSDTYPDWAVYRDGALFGVVDTLAEVARLVREAEGAARRDCDAAAAS